MSTLLAERAPIEETEEAPRRVVIVKIEGLRLTGLRAQAADWQEKRVKLLEQAELLATQQAEAMNRAEVLRKLLEDIDLLIEELELHPEWESPEPKMPEPPRAATPRLANGNGNGKRPRTYHNWKSIEGIARQILSRANRAMPTQELKEALEKAMQVNYPLNYHTFLKMLKELKGIRRTGHERAAFWEMEES